MGSAVMELEEDSEEVCLVCDGEGTLWEEDAYSIDRCRLLHAVYCECPVGERRRRREEDHYGECES